MATAEQTICEQRGTHRIRGTGYNTQEAPPAGFPAMKESCDDCNEPLKVWEMESPRKCEFNGGHRIRLAEFPLKKKSATAESPWTSQRCDRCGVNVTIHSQDGDTLETWKDRNIIIVLPEKKPAK